ncbi:NAD(P)H-dependent oxidoreductase [Spirillospora sp. NBC_00431]
MRPGTERRSVPPTATDTVRLLAIGGSTRGESGSAHALADAVAVARSAGADVTVVSGRDLMLPIYDPASPYRSAGAQDLLAAVRAADALVISSPGYHGTLSGMIKNALDYLEDLRGDRRPYLDGVPVGCIAVAHGWQTAVGTLHTLRTSVHALRGWPSPLGVAINAAAPGSNGQLAETSDKLATMTGQVVEFALASKLMTQRSG